MNKNMCKPLVLASQSVYRRQLLEKLSVPFYQDSANIDESSKPNESPIKLVERLAIEKALVVAKRHPESIIIASDQLASINNTVLTKPGCFDIAKQQLQQLSGQTVTFYTSLCVLDSETMQYTVLVEPVTVKFRSLSDALITRYLNKEQPYDCVGSFKSEGLGVILFDAIESSDPNTLIGLPLIKLVPLLEAHGYTIPLE